VEDEQGPALFGEAADLARLPVEMQFRVAQMDYNTFHHGTIKPHLALRDFLNVSFPLLYGVWDSQKYEKGGHRSDNDGYRRECYLRLVDKCLQCAKTFHGFRNKDCYYHKEGTGPSPTAKRRKIVTTNIRGPSSSTTTTTVSSMGIDLVAVSKVLFELRMVKKAEERLSRAPPPRLY
jgi:hypothetical protein